MKLSPIIPWVVVAVLVQGCEVLKTKRRVTTDTVYVSKIDSGYLNKTNTVKTDSFQWWRMIMDYRDKGDTNITNVYNNTYPQPKVVVVEGGTGSSQTIIQQVDSGWKQRYDSLSTHRTTEDKSKETKVLTQWWIWAIMAGMGLLVIVLLFGRFFSITKK
jgi:hypothetical protein